MKERRNTEGITGRDSLQGEVCGDASMKCIVYDEWAMGPVRYAIQEIARLCEEDRMEDAIRAASDLGRSSHIISPDLIAKLDPLMSKMVIRCTKPDLKWDISPLEPSIEKLWHVVTMEMNPAYYASVEPWIYRWYEHQGRYKEARQIQCQCIAFYRKQGDRQREAETMNSLGYECFSERRWKKAIALFEEAAEIYRKVGPRESYANARANYWMGRFHRGDMEAADIARLNEEIKDLPGSSGEHTMRDNR